MGGDKRIVVYPHKPHNGLLPEDVWVGEISRLQDDFLRRHLAGD
jgi:hypothetical protein